MPHDEEYPDVVSQDSHDRPTHTPVGHGGSGRRDRRDCPEYCFQGSTEFYDSPQEDEFTPSYLEAGLLEFNVGTRSDGTVPAWINPDSTLSPIEQYVEWFNGIWHTGDPTSWNETVFTNQAVMIDPTGTSKGAKQAASGFLLLFKYYPDLRGEVVSWAANNREILINWRFVVKRRDGQQPLLVPVVDKFCFLDGRVSHRLAYYDILTFIGYLTDNFGQSQLTDYLRASIAHAEATGGIQNVPRLVWNIIKGLFVWPADVDMRGLRATPGDGLVSLEWDAVPDAISYKINRSTDLAGPFEPPPDDPNDGEVPTNSYVDTQVTNGVTYWYLVSPNYATWEPMPALSESSLSRLGYARGGRRHRRVYGVSRGEQVEAVPAEGTPYSRSAAGHEHRPKTPSNN